MASSYDGTGPGAAAGGSPFFDDLRQDKDVRKLFGVFIFSSKKIIGVKCMSIR